MMATFVLSAFADEISPEVDTQIRELKRQGIGYVEFRSAAGKGVLDFTDGELRELAQRFRDEGIGISALGSPVGKVSIDTPFDACMEQVRRGLAEAQAMGTPIVRLFSYYIDGHEPEACRGEVLRRMEGMVRLAEGTGLTLLLENELHLYGDNAPRCHDILSSLDAPQLRMTFDPSNFVQCGQDVLEAYALLKPWIAYLHLKDSVWSGNIGKASMGYRDASDVHRPLGQGDGQIAAWAAALRGDGYQGFASIEPHLAQVASVPGTGVEKFAVAVAAAKRYFGEVQTNGKADHQ